MSIVVALGGVGCSHGREGSKGADEARPPFAFSVGAVMLDAFSPLTILGDTRFSFVGIQARARKLT